MVKLEIFVYKGAPYLVDSIWTNIKANDNRARPVWAKVQVTLIDIKGEVANLTYDFTRKN